MPAAVKINPYRKRADVPDASARQLAALDAHYGEVEKGISERVRYICFGVAAVVYALFSSDSLFAGRLIESAREPLVWSAIFAVLAIAADFIRQLCRYASSAQAYKNSAYDWDTTSIFYRGSEALNWVVLAFLVMAVATFLFAMSNMLTQRSEPPPDPIEARISALEESQAETRRAIDMLSQRLDALPPPPRPAQPCRVRSERWSSNGDYQRICAEP